MNKHLMTTAILILGVTNTLKAAVIEYGTDQRDEWFTDVGGLSNVSTADFVGYPDFTPIDEQWAHLGVHFSGSVFTSGESPFLYPNDAWGIEGYPDINVSFDHAMQWIAADFPGRTIIELYNNDSLIYTSSILGASGAGFFGGLVSDQPFNRARFYDSAGAHADFLDDLHFGPPIPAPSAIALFAMLLRTSRRRRET